MKIKAFPILLLVGLIPWLTVSLSGQEAVETAPDTTITEEANTNIETTSTGISEEETEISMVGDTTGTAPIRYVSAEDLNELTSAQEDLSNANAIVQYILSRMIRDYRINVQTEVLNIKTGAITSRATATQ